MNVFAIGWPATGLPWLSNPFLRSASRAAGVPGAGASALDDPGMNVEGENGVPGAVVEAVGAGVV
jgi:hypothetical protein